MQFPSVSDVARSQETESVLDERDRLMLLGMTSTDLNLSRNLGYSASHVRSTFFGSERHHRRHRPNKGEKEALVFGVSTRQRIDLRYVEDTLESAFVASFVENTWVPRLACVCTFMVGLGASVLVMPNSWPLINILCFSACGVLGLAMGTLTILKRIFERMPLNDCSMLHWRLKQPREGYHRGGDEDEEEEEQEHVAAQRNDAADCVEDDNTLQSRRVVAAENSSRVAFWGEFLSFFSICVVNSLYMAAVVLSRHMCWDVSLAIRQKTCYAAFYNESVPAMISFAMAIVSPVRFSLYVVTNTTLVVVFILANVLGPAIAFDAKRFCGSLVVTAAQLAVCVVWVYVRERDQRQTFLRRLQQEEATVDLHEVQRRTREAASGRLPRHVVDAVSTRGGFEASGMGIAFGVCLANFGRWAENRGPCDLVHVLQQYAVGIDTIIHNIFSDQCHVTVTRLQGFGEFAVFVVMPRKEEGDDEGGQWITEMAPLVGPRLMESLMSLEESLRRHQRRGAKSPLLASYALRSDQHPHQYLAPVGAATSGLVWQRFLPCVASGILGGGCAVMEVYERLLSFQLDGKPSVRMHLPPQFFDPQQQPIAPVAVSSVDGLVRVSDTTRILDYNAFVGSAVSKNYNENRKMDDTPTSSPSAAVLVVGGDVESAIVLEHWYSFPHFSSPHVETAFRSHSQKNFSLDLVRVNAVSMMTLGLAMLAVCAIYDVFWDWQPRASFPYVVSAFLCGVLLLACTFSPSLAAHCGVLDAFYWMFYAFCLAASVMPPQYQSIFGASILPWSALGTMLANMRPVWYGPLAMTTMHNVCFVFVLLCLLLNARDGLLVQLRFISFYVSAMYVVLFVVLCRFLDISARRVFQAVFQLSQLHTQLHREVTLLKGVLEDMVPVSVARSMIRHAESRYQRHSLLSQKRHATVHPLHSSSFTTRVKDQVFAVMCVRVDYTQSVSTQMAAISSINIAMLDWARASRLQFVKSTGDMMMLTGDGYHGDPLGVDGQLLLLGIQSCREMLRKSLGTTMCAILDVCPMTGALLGKHLSTFEWCAPEIHRALMVLRLGPSQGPLEWGDIACTQRICYHIDQCTSGERVHDRFWCRPWGTYHQWSIPGVSTRLMRVHFAERLTRYFD